MAHQPRPLTEPPFASPVGGPQAARSRVHRYRLRLLRILRGGPEVAYAKIPSQCGLHRRRRAADQDSIRTGAVARRETCAGRIAQAPVGSGAEAAPKNPI